MLDSIPLQFVGVSSTEDLVAGDLGADDLANNISICEPDNESVFWCVVFVFGLSNQAFTSIVISFTSTTALILSLIAATEVLAFHATTVESDEAKRHTCSTRCS